MIMIFALSPGWVEARVVILPDSVTSIGEGAYRGDTTITEFRAGTGSRLIEIGAEAFRGCTSLRRVELPGGVRKIGRAAFIYCASLEEINFPQGLERIGLNAFTRCANLREARLPDSVIELESYAFSDCEGLRAVRLPGNSSLLGELMFSGCVNLQVIEEPSPEPPPFDCRSFLVEPDEEFLYSRLKLLVPSRAVQLYREAHGWRLIHNIEGPSTFQ